LDVLITGIVFGFFLTILAGPILFALVQTGIEEGFWAGMWVAYGVFFSDALFVTIVYFMLEKIQEVVNSPNFFLMLGVIGGLALIGIGLANILSKPPEVPELKNISEDDSTTLSKPRRVTPRYNLFSKGFVINTLNPFTFFFWGMVASGKMAEIATKNAAEGNSSQAEFFLFFGGILSVIILSDTLKVYAAKAVRRLLTPKKILLVRKISGIAFIVFGILLMVRVMIMD